MNYQAKKLKKINRKENDGMSKYAVKQEFNVGKLILIPSTSNADQQVIP